MKEAIIITAETLDAALLKVTEEYHIPKESIQYTIRKDAKSGVFGIVPKSNLEIEIVLEEDATTKKIKRKRKEKTHSLETQSTTQVIEEELIPLGKLSLSEREVALAIAQEVITKIVFIFSDTASIESRFEENTIYINIEQNEDTKPLIGKDLEILKALQYIVYKIVTQHVRCLFSLHITLGDTIVSEETLLIGMINKLIEKVKTTRKTQRTYPLNREQRTIVQEIIAQETDVVIKKQKVELDVQPLILLYVGDAVVE